MWYHVINWADQEYVLSVTPSCNRTRICVCSYSGLHHHFKVLEKDAFLSDLMSERVINKISKSKAKDLIKGLAIDSIERIFANDLD